MQLQRHSRNTIVHLKYWNSSNPTSVSQATNDKQVSELPLTAAMQHDANKNFAIFIDDIVSFRLIISCQTSGISNPPTRKLEVCVSAICFLPFRRADHGPPCLLNHPDGKKDAAWCDGLSVSKLKFFLPRVRALRSIFEKEVFRLLPSSVLCWEGPRGTSATIEVLLEGT
jgi:hypothetical protein